MVTKNKNKNSNKRIILNGLLVTTKWITAIICLIYYLMDMVLLFKFITITQTSSDFMVSWPKTKSCDKTSNNKNNMMMAIMTMKKISNN